jgi:uracil-DNA glycosylase family 4
MIEPSKNCPYCPRLAEFRARNRETYPAYRNAPVPSFGSIDAKILIVGLAPGLHGANATGRPFTNDYAGDLLYPSLIKFGLATGEYDARADDGLTLKNCRITNAARCVPPENKPLPAELAACRQFLVSEIAAMKNLAVFLALGTVAHNALLVTLGLKQAAYKFAHGARHDLPGGQTLFDSYHCSRYNTNTGRLTTAMFEAVVGNVARQISD